MFRIFAILLENKIGLLFQFSVMCYEAIPPKVRKPSSLQGDSLIAFGGDSFVAHKCLFNEFL